MIWTHRRRAKAGSAPGQETSRLAWLDALRGFAALCVVFDHAAYGVLQHARESVYHWTDPGQYGVFVFFLVSGYIIPASLERKGSLRAFWIGRAFRLYPLYALAIIASVIAYETGLGGLQHAQQVPFTSAASPLLTLPNLLGGTNAPNVVWTLSYEMTFYLLVAALYSVRAHQRSGLYAVGSGVIVPAVGGLLPMAALNKYNGTFGPGHVALLADLLIAAGITVAVGSRDSRLVACGAWLAAITGLLLLTVNQTLALPVDRLHHPRVHVYRDPDLPGRAGTGRESQDGADRDRRAGDDTWRGALVGDCSSSGRDRLRPMAVAVRHRACRGPRLISDGDIEVIVTAARTRPEKLGQPFTHWSLRKLAGYLAGLGRPVRIGRERLRQLLHERGSFFQRTRTWIIAPTASATSRAATAWAMTSCGASLASIRAPITPWPR